MAYDHRAYQKEWRAKNKDKCREYSRRWGSKNPERIREFDRARYQRDRDKRLALANEWGRNNKERKSAAHKAWYQKNRAHVLVKTKVPLDETARSLIGRYEFGCSYCGSHERLEVDHVMPLGRGGLNIAANLQWLCRNCNRAKSDLLEEEFFSHIRKVIEKRDNSPSNVKLLKASS